MATAVNKLVEKIKSLPDQQHRAVSALLGARVADAATRPLHWIYDHHAMENIAHSNNPEFWPQSESPFYTLPLGHCSGYNDTALASLTSLNKTNGCTDIASICDEFNIRFGEGSDYADAYARRKVPYNAEKRWEFVGPIDGPWLQKAMIKFLENFANGCEVLGGADCNEHDGFCAALPVVAIHAGKETMWDEAGKVCRLLTSHAETIAMNHTEALLVSHYITGTEDVIEHVTGIVESIYPDVHELLEEVLEACSLPYLSTVATLGKACYLPGSFQSSVLTLLRSGSYVDAVRMNITAGGCNCCRANVVGACLGAKYGVDAIPVEWLEKVNGIVEVGEMAINVIVNSE